MSSDDELYSGEPDQDEDSQSELARLNALHDDLVEAVQTAINPTVRADLAAELRSVRERIAELSATDSSGARRSPEPGATVHSYEVPPSAPVESNGAGGYGAGPQRYDEEPYVPPAHGGPGAPGFGQPPGYGYQDPGYGQQPPYGAPGPTSDPMWARPGPGFDPRTQTSFNVQQEAPRSFWSSRPWLPLVLAILGGLALAAIVGFGGLFGDDDGETATADGDGAAEGDPSGPAVSETLIAEIRTMLDGMGHSSVVVEDRDGSVALLGTVNSDADRQAVIAAASALAGGLPFDSSGLTVAGGGEAAPAPTADPASPAAAMQRELNRILAVNPITFDEGQVAVTERHQLVLNNVVTTMSAYAAESVVVVGFTDDQGSPEANERLSAARAQNVKDYLVSQGVPADRLTVRAVGEAEATGIDNVAVLERRVEFEVVGSAAAGSGGLRVGLVAPSASNDLAFTQSMVDSINLVAAERGLDVTITDGTFVVDDAEIAMQGYADQGFDLIIAHGSQYAPIVQKLAPLYPNVAFAWGTASETFGLPNVYAYDAKSEQGGYVLGALAGQLTSSGTIGVVGPFEIGDATLFVNGFSEGATVERPGTNVLVDYIDSFSDTNLASDAAGNHLAAGADVLTGSSQMVVGAVNRGASEGALWFGTQANQTALAPELVVASQVYHWEVLLRPILDDLASGTLAGAASSLTLANQGLVIEYNEAYPIPAEVRQRGDELVAEIAAGSIVPTG